jgi:hypothetical protein
MYIFFKLDRAYFKILHRALDFAGSALTIGDKLF